MLQHNHGSIVRTARSAGHAARMACMGDGARPALVLYFETDVGKTEGWGGVLVELCLLNCIFSLSFFEAKGMPSERVWNQGVQAVICD